MNRLRQLGRVVALTAAAVVAAAAGTPARAQLAHWWNFSETGTASGTVYADKAQTLLPGVADMGVLPSSMTTQGAPGAPLGGASATVNGGNAVRVLNNTNYITSLISNFGTDFGRRDGDVSFTLQSMVQVNGWGTNGNGYIFGDNTAPGPAQIYAGSGRETWAYSGNNNSNYSGGQMSQRWAMTAAEVSQFGGWCFMTVRGDAATGLMDLYVTPVGQTTMANSLIHVRGPYSGIAKAANTLMLGGGRPKYEATQWNNGVALYSEARTIDQINYDYQNWFNPQPGNTWWGNGATTNWSAAKNWTSGVPVSGEYRFGNLYGVQNATSTNDAVGLSVAGLRFLGASDQAGINAGSVTITGNALTVTGTVTDNSTNPQTIALPLTLGAGAGTFAVGSGGLLTVSQPITTAVGLGKTGAGTLVLTGTNTYAGTTTVSAGALEANDRAGLSAASNLTLAGGVLQGNGTAAFTRTVGTSAGQVQWTGDGGFAARGGTLTVTLDNDAATPLAWGTGGFVPAGNALLFGSASANGRVVLTNAIDLNWADRTVQVNPGKGGDLAELSGVISGTGPALVKAGAGTLILSGANTYSGNTRVVAGALEATDGVGLGQNSTLELAGGVFQGAGTATFTRAVGTSAGQVQWTGTGGFAARGGTLTVALNNDTSTQLVWGYYGFVPDGSALAFGSTTSDSRVNFQNGISLNAASRTIQVTAGTGNEVAEISGSISDFIPGSGITKTGTGTLYLSYPGDGFFTSGNSYDGSTTIRGGALEAGDGVGLPAASNLVLAGGVFQGSGRFGAVQFTRGLGSGANQVQWTGDGGFAARDAKMLVTINGSAPLTWGGTNFVPDAAALVFGSNSANAETEMRNPVNFGTSLREVRVNPGTGADFATLSGVLSGGTGGGLTKTGTGVLKVTGTNTYTGGTAMAAGTLLLGSAAGLGTSGTITFTGNSTLRWDSGITADLSARLKVNDGVTATIDTNGNNLTFNGVTAVGAAVTGVLNKAGAGDLTLGTGTLAAGTASQGFYAGRVTISGGRIVLGNPYPLQNALLTYDNQGGTLSFGTQTAATIGSISGSQALDISNVTLTVGSNIYNSTATTSAVGIAAANANTSTTYSGSLTGIGTAALVKSGVGTLTLSGANAYAGSTTINGGALGIANAASLTAGNVNLAGTLLTGTAVPTGGLVESNDTVLAGGFTRAIGTGSGQIQWTGHGGFSARGGTLTVNLGGGSPAADFNWAATGGPGTNQLLLGWGTSDATVDFQNPILLTSSAAATRTINVSAGSGSVPEGRISGQIKETAGFVGTLTKAGTGTLELANGTNSYSGITTVGSGVLRVSAAGALGSNATAAAVTLTSGNLELRSDASTNFQPVATAGVTVSGNVAISVDRAAGGAGVNGTHTLGPLSMGGQTLTIRGGNGYGLTFGNVTLTGSPTLANNAPGTLTVGSITAPAAATTLTFQGIGGTTVGGAITQNAANAVSLTMSGAGVLRLNGASTATGPATINSGTVSAGTAAALGSAAVTVNAGSLLAGSGVTLGNAITVSASGLYTQNFNALSSLPAGWSAYTGASSTSIGTAAAFTGSATAWNVTSGQFANVASAASPSAATDPSITQAGRTDRALGIVQASGFGDPGASLDYSFSTAGRTVTGISLDLQSLNPVGGATTWSLQYGLGAAPTSWTTIDTWTDPNSWGSTTKAYGSSVLGTGLDNRASVVFRVVALNPQAASAPFNTVAIDNFTLNYGQALGSDITSGSAGFSGAVTLNNTAQLTAAGTSTVTFSGRLTGTGGVSKIGSGTVVLSGDVNNYFGTTLVQQGTLAYGAVNAVASGSTVTVNGGRLDTGSFGGAIAGLTLTAGSVVGTGALTVVGPIVANDPGPVTVSAPLSGNVPLTKSAAGTLTLSGANTFSGGTTITAGTLVVAGSSALGTGAVAVQGGTLSVGVDATMGATLVTQSGRLALDSAVTRTVSVGSLTVDQSVGSPVIDLGVGRIQITAGADATTIRDLILAGFAAGSWTGSSGITSSAAAASDGTRTVGYQVAGDGSALLAFAAPGDANLDGQVNTLDLVAMTAAGKFGTGAAAVWSDGDFNYDGVVNSLDLVAINGSGAWGIGTYLPLPTSPFVAIPEPAPAGLIATALLLSAGAARRHIRRRGRGGRGSAASHPARGPSRTLLGIGDPLLKTFLSKNGA